MPRKQAAKRHYGSHQYFTKRPWNVVQEYIKRYSQPGDVVCDPYGGSGVTAIEALVLGRKAVYLDISEWATFLATQVAVAPVDLIEFNQCFSELEDARPLSPKRFWRRLTRRTRHDELLISHTARLNVAVGLGCTFHLRVATRSDLQVRAIAPSMAITVA